MNKEKKHIIYHLPKKLPMICKPKLYSSEEIEGKVKEKLGGYLLNDERTIEPIIKKSWENKEHSSILKNNIIYDLINNINSIPYQVNSNVFDFIFHEKPEYFEDVIIWEGSIHPLLEKTRLTIKQKKELDSYLRRNYKITL